MLGVWVEPSLSRPLPPSPPPRPVPVPNKHPRFCGRPLKQHFKGGTSPAVTHWTEFEDVLLMVFTAGLCSWLRSLLWCAAHTISQSKLHTRSCPYIKRGLAENKVWPTLRAPLSGTVVNQCLEFGAGPAGQSSDTPADLAEHLSNLRELSVSVGKLWIHTAGCQTPSTGLRHPSSNQRYSREVFYWLMMMMSWCLMSSDVIWHIRDKLWPMPKHGSIKSTYVRCMRV